MPDLLAQAIQYVEKYRFSVIPVHAGDKRPAVVEWETFQHRRPTLEELGAWFKGKTHHNIGIVCGAISGIVVIDVDGEKGEESILSRPMPSHLVMVKTPHGRHLYFRHPGVPVPPRVGVLPGVDIRGDGSYVVAPPSKIGGKAYQWIRSDLDVPDQLPAQPTWVFNGGPKPQPHEPGWIRELLDGVEQGRRDESCTRLAGFYLKRGLRPEEVIDTLIPWGRRCRPPFPEEDVRKCVESVATREKDRRSPLALEAHDWADVAARVRAAPRRTWLFRGIWPEDAYGVIGADDKAGKTWAAVDAGISVATGSQWLDHFAVDAAGPVVLFLGEGGEANTYRRVSAILESRGGDENDLAGDFKVVYRVPQLTARGHIEQVAEILGLHAPRAVILDPLYLAARGADGSSLYMMGDALHNIQSVCQDAGAALMVTTHLTKTGIGEGFDRLWGSGPGAWGRVLGLFIVDQKFRANGQSRVVGRWRFRGGEIEDQQFRMDRTIWSDNPNYLDSPLHYEVTVEPIEDGQIAAFDGMSPSVERVRSILAEHAADPPGLTSWQIGDFAARDRKGPALKPRTIQSALRELFQAALVDNDAGGLGGIGKRPRWWTR